MDYLIMAREDVYIYSAIPRTPRKTSWSSNRVLVRRSDAMSVSSASSITYTSNTDMWRKPLSRISHQSALSALQQYKDRRLRPMELEAQVVAFLAAT